MLNSLGRWEEARECYLESADGFRISKGYLDPSGGSSKRLYGQVYAASNAALMLAQLGDDGGATREMEVMLRKGPGSVDIRAALAAQYYADGRTNRAEEMWDAACTKIAVGCRKYKDEEWLHVIRRWPPLMVERMQNFLQLRTE